MLNLYSVKDKASDTFINPLSMATDRDAIDGFRTLSNDGKSNFSKFPGDFILVKLGSFNPRNAEFDVHEPIELCSAEDLQEQKEG